MLVDGDPVQAEPAVGDRVVQVDQQDALHAVEGEPLPHLDPEQGRELARLPEEGLVILGGRLRHRLGCGHASKPCHRRDGPHSNRV